MTKTKSVFCLVWTKTKSEFTPCLSERTKSGQKPSLSQTDKALIYFIYKWEISLPSKSRERSVAA